MQQKINKLLFFSICICLASCKINPDSNRNYADKNKIYKLCLNAVSGSRYHYDISNQSEVSLEVNDKKVRSLNKSVAGLFYEINKDSSGNFILSAQYDKLHLYSKKDDTETDADADNAVASLDPVEKMLGNLKGAKISATVNSKGDVVNTTGYKEVEEKIFSQLSFPDANTKNLVRQQIDKLIGDGIVKNNMDELFKIFPDSAVHIGDTWKINEVQNGLNLKNIYKLKAINDNIAIVESEGTITADSSLINSTGFNNMTGNLRGSQQGQYEMETKTGMLISSNVKASVKGNVSANGNDVPVAIETSVKINGKKIN